jgi:hypothetical protein
MKVLLEDQVKGKTTGSSLKGYINCVYQDLIRVLGEPTYSTPSGDNKVQKEWVVAYNGEVFTIYDWKTYDEEYTMNELDQFHIGGKTDAYDFFLELKEMIDGEG